MKVEAEVSMYPLGRKDLGTHVRRFIEGLRDCGCQIEIGDMSSLVTGDSSQVFDALRQGYDCAAAEGGCVLIVKACNVCPL